MVQISDPVRAADHGQILQHVVDLPTVRRGDP
jgi:hypothetical protein